jgi:hypothetical protein
VKNISLEIISYQNKDSFPVKLTSIINSIKKDIDNRVYKDNNEIMNKSPYVSEIEKLIKERFNLNIVMDKKLHMFYPAAIIPFFNDYIGDYTSLKGIGADVFSKIFQYGNISSHVNSINKEKTKILNQLHNKTGTIDFKKARVTGYLSKIKHFLIIDFTDLFGLGLTSEEITSVILHEIGHTFTGLEYHHKLETTNSTIVDILNEINNNNIEKANYIFKKHFTEEEFKDFVINSNKDVYDFNGKIALGYLNTINTQMINAKYDETNFENLADSFAVRFNMGKELVSSLNKIHRTYKVILNNTKGLFVTLLIVDILSKLLFIALLGPYGVAFSILLIVTVFNSSNTVMTYDLPIDRYNRIKNSIINNLKNIDLPEDITVDLLSQFKFLTEVIEKSLYYKEVLHRLADYVLFSNRDNNYYINLQKDIENNLNNLLFIKAQQVRTN